MRKLIDLMRKFYPSIRTRSRDTPATLFEDEDPEHRRYCIAEFAAMFAHNAYRTSSDAPFDIVLDEAMLERAFTDGDIRYLGDDFRGFPAKPAICVQYLALRELAGPRGSPKLISSTMRPLRGDHTVPMDVIGEIIDDDRVRLSFQHRRPSMDGGR